MVQDMASLLWPLGSGLKGLAVVSDLGNLISKVSLVCTSLWVYTLGVTQGSSIGALDMGPWTWGPGLGVLALGSWPWGPGPQVMALRTWPREPGLKVQASGPWANDLRALVWGPCGSRPSLRPLSFGLWPRGPGFTTWALGPLL